MAACHVFEDPLQRRRGAEHPLQLALGHLVHAGLEVLAVQPSRHLEVFLHCLGGPGGVAVDDRMRTSAAGVYAAGDVAEAQDRLTGERYVHAIFPNAVAQAEVAALNILGIDTAYAG